MTTLNPKNNPHFTSLAGASKNIKNVLLENLNEQKNKLGQYLLATPIKPNCDKKKQPIVRSVVQKNETLLFQNSSTRRSKKHKE